MTLQGRKTKTELSATVTRIGLESKIGGVFIHLLWLFPATLLVVALMRLPYGYYTLLRLIVCGCAGFSAWLIYARSNGRISMAVLTAVALLYNPFVIVRLNRGEWAPINLATAAIFASVGWFSFRRLTVPGGVGPKPSNA